MLTFEITSTIPSGAARRGRLSTSRGSIETPVFMPVGTKATVKALTPEELRRAGVEILLANTFHLELRPGSALIERLGGLHGFMRWDGPILTDSGGFQVFSLAKLRKVTEDGVEFRSPVDGTLCRLTPESAVEIQRRFGSDIVMAFDECVEAGVGREVAQRAMERTLVWLDRCRRVSLGERQTLFPIVQGGHHADLRRESARRTMEHDGWSGVAIGGLSVGEAKPVMLEMLEASVGELPRALPRYLMGVGTPEDLIEGVERGVDLFDCVYPTRTARLGRLFAEGGHIHIKNARFREDPGPIEQGCDCETCRGGFSRAYLHHLYHSNEILAHRLNTVHNVRSIVRLMEEVRAAITEGRWETWRKEKLGNLRAGKEAEGEGEADG